jgi:hypothetical protein
MASAEDGRVYARVFGLFFFLRDGGEMVTRALVRFAEEEQGA